MQHQLIDNQFVIFAFGLLSIVFVAFIVRYNLLSLDSGGASSQKMPFFSPFFAAAIMPLVGGFVGNAVTPYLHFEAMQNFAIAQAIALVAALIVLLGFVRIHSEQIQGKIFGSKPLVRAIAKGVFYCIMIYPIVMLGMQCIHLLINYIQPGARAEQDAVRLFRKLQATPWLFWTFGFFACTLIPIVEELLFRGFFQNWLVDRFGNWIGVTLAATLFAAAHFSYAQGISNIELLIGLFAMGFLLGIVYIKEESLATSVAMHGTFNGFTLLLFSL